MAKALKRFKIKVWRGGGRAIYCVIRGNFQKNFDRRADAQKWIDAHQPVEHNPTSLIPKSWRSAYVRRLRNGQVQVKIPMSRGRR